MLRAVRFQVFSLFVLFVVIFLLLITRVYLVSQTRMNVRAIYELQETELELMVEFNYLRSQLKHPGNAYFESSIVEDFEPTN